MAAEDLILRIHIEGGRVAAADVEGVGSALGRTEQRARRAHSSILNFGGALGGLRRVIGIAAGVTGLGGMALGLGEMIKNAEGFQNSAAQLGAAIRANIRNPTRDALNVLREYADQLSIRGGLAPQQEFQALTLFVRVTKSQTAAQRDLALATNMVRGGHISLERATRAIIMLEQGRAQGLSRMGIRVQQVTTAEDALKRAHAGATVEQLRAAKVADAVRTQSLIATARAQGLSRMGIKKVTTAEDALRTSHGKVTIEEQRAAKAADALATRHQALAAVTRQYAGAAGVYNRTAAGAMQNFMHVIDLVGEHLGMLLLPSLTKVFTSLSKFIGKLLDHNTGPGREFVVVIKDAGQALKVVWSMIQGVGNVLTWMVKGWKDNNAAVLAIVGVLTGLIALGVANKVLMIVKATKDWAAAQELLNLIMDDNAVGIVIVAIAALVGAIVVAYAKVKWFREGVNAVFSWLKGAVVDTVHWISQHWWVLGAILGGPFLGIAVFIATHFSQVKNVVIAMLNWMIDRVNDAINAINAVSGSIPIFGSDLHINTIGKISTAAPTAAAPSTLQGDKALLGHRWMGGPIQHSGVYDVGEHGHEHVYLPQGSYVDNGDHSGMAQAMADALSGAGVYMDGRQVGQLIVRQGRIQAARQ